MLKTKGSRWETVDGVPSIVFRSIDVRGKVVEISVPLSAFILLGNQAKVRLTAAEFAKVKASGPPQWHHALFHEVQTMTVGTVETTETQRVGLILDQGLESELSLSLSPSHARDLAQALVATANEIGQSSGETAKH